MPEENDARYKRIVFQDKAAGIKDALRTEIEESEALLLRGRNLFESGTENAGKFGF